MGLFKNIGSAFKDLGKAVQSVVAPKKTVQKLASDISKNPEAATDFLKGADLVKTGVIIGGTVGLASGLAPIIKGLITKVPVTSTAAPLVKKVTTSPVFSTPTDAEIMGIPGQGVVNAVIPNSGSNLGTLLNTATSVVNKGSSLLNQGTGLAKTIQSTLPMTKTTKTADQYLASNPQIMGQISSSIPMPPELKWVMLGIGLLIVGMVLYKII